MNNINLLYTQVNLYNSIQAVQLHILYLIYTTEILHLIQDIDLVKVYRLNSSIEDRVNDNNPKVRILFYR